MPELHDAPMLTADDEAPVTKPSGGTAAPEAAASSAAPRYAAASAAAQHFSIIARRRAALWRPRRTALYFSNMGLAHEG